VSHTFWEEKGIYWPDCENRKDFDHALNRIDAIDAALGLCKGRDVCLQAGGWIGMWPAQLASHFKHVITYEPVPYLFACLAANVSRLCVGKVVTARTAALGARDGSLELTVALSGCTSAVPEDSAKYQSRVIEKRTVPMVTIDGECAALKAVDAIFLDVERFEIAVLEGAKQTIKKFSPVITVEVLKGEDKKMEEYMTSIGYSLRARSHNDRIYTR
jgi:FkbM family methyltransferase